MVNDEPVNVGGGGGAESDLKTLGLYAPGVAAWYAFEIDGDTIYAGPNAETGLNDAVGRGELSGSMAGLDGHTPPDEPLDDYRFNGNVTKMLFSPWNSYSGSQPASTEGVIVTVDGERLSLSDVEAEEVSKEEMDARMSQGDLSEPVNEEGESITGGGSGLGGLFDWVPELLPGIGPLSSRQTTLMAGILALAVIGSVVTG